jgi:hypothetical protein
MPNGFEDSSLKPDKGIKETDSRLRLRLRLSLPSSGVVDWNHRRLLPISQWLESEHWSDTNSRVARGVALFLAHININPLSEDISMGIHVYWPHDCLRQLYHHNIVWTGVLASASAISHSLPEPWPSIISRAHILNATTARQARIQSRRAVPARPEQEGWGPP